ncbi:heavy metal-associated isoprenylated plant protein 1-like [Momordica charantia]|uniref:Heavy metal-associated isoprenylated plant protein 1-like n=1 Tax=Momordica charantia TaxID=3673 RepID=A0A6J1C4S0_MOMCH|nr:heavy metal-associated isoprenylated plant protein 1-like [Momordica charantia]
MSEKKKFCMVMKINVDCNACCRKLRRIILGMKAIEMHVIEKERYRVIVFGRFTPADVAIKIRKKMNRRVEILDVEEMEPDPPAADQDQPEQNQIQPPPAFPGGGFSMFPSLEHDNRRPIFPSLSANECRSFSSSRPDFTVTCFPEPDKFWHYYGLQLAGDTDSAYYAHNPNYY